LTLPIIAFAGWAMFTSDPFGGEPMAVAPAIVSADTSDTQDGPTIASPRATPPRNEPEAPPGTVPGQLVTVPGKQPSAPAKTKTVTIIDGTNGKRREIPISETADGEPSAPPAQSPPPGKRSSAAPPVGKAGASEQRFAEPSRHGPLPRIAQDGTRPSDAFAQPRGPASTAKPGAPRVSIVVGGLGVGAAVTADAMRKLPGAVTLAFAPYGNDLARQVARAREAGHEVMLQVPMEPLDYPDNDPGPHTLLTSLDAKENLDRLHWVMSRFQGYVGLVNIMGGRFTASEQSLGQVLREASARGLIYLDDSSSRRSMANQIAGANNLAFAKADLILDRVPTPTDVDRSLGRLESIAQARGIAVGVASALPVSIDRISQWIKGAESRGIQLVPITAAVMRGKAT
jgi:polysaccharide deacetylase 2 family uncharacterized protein YibQ